MQHQTRGLYPQDGARRRRRGRSLGRLRARAQVASLLKRARRHLGKSASSASASACLIVSIVAAVAWRSYSSSLSLPTKSIPNQDVKSKQPSRLEPMPRGPTEPSQNPRAPAVAKKCNMLKHWLSAPSHVKCRGCRALQQPVSPSLLSPAFGVPSTPCCLMETKPSPSLLDAATWLRAQMPASRRQPSTGRGNGLVQAAISFLSSLILAMPPPATLALKSLSLLASLGRAACVSLQILMLSSM